MLRKDLVAGINEVLAALEKSRMLEVFRAGRSEKGRQEISIGLTALRDYSIAANAFSAVGKKVTSVFGLGILEDPQGWIPMLTEDSPIKAKVTRSMMVIKSELPKLIELLHQDTITHQPSQEAGGFTQVVTVDVLRISLVEEKGQFSTIQRVIEGLTACQELYESLQKMNGDLTTPLAVGAIDSGSDKSFDLFGAAELMKQFRELVVSIWGLIVFHREHKLGKRLELITSALPILERVNALEQANKLGREEAQIIRNGIIDGAKKFIASGVITQELSAHSTYDPRLLMAPEPKLLTGPLPADSGDSVISDSNSQGRNQGQSRRNDAPVPSLSNLSSEDLDQLADRLLQRSAQVKRDATCDSDNTTENENGG